MLKQMLIPNTARKMWKVRSSGLLKLAGIIVCIGYLSVSGYARTYPCLPDDVTEDVVVRVVRRPTVKKITVRQTLKELKAKCSKGILVDGKKREIKFYNVIGCWGNPPEDYLEIQSRQRRELTELKSKYTVVELSCDVNVQPQYRIP